MVDVVTFGEAMIRLSPPQARRLEQTQVLDASVGGAELNVAVGVCRLGLSSAWVSCLPDNALGRLTRNKARELGVDTRWVRWDSQGRMGLYFVEYGSSPRASSILYDRAGSSISQLNQSFAWDEILLGARVFHMSGVTPALSNRVADETQIALETAHRLGLTVMYDLNYRARLWTEEQARRVQEPLMQFVDVLITTEEDTRRVFGIEGKDYGEVARLISNRYSIPIVTITVRGDSSVLRNEWTSIAYSDGQLFEDRTYKIELVDRIGGGDAYSAGFICGFLEGDTGHAVQIGDAFSALKQTTWSDFGWVTRQEVDALLSGSGLRIVR